MKVNLLLDNDKDCLNGYINIDPFVPDNPSPNEKRIKGEITNLDFIVDDAEAEEIIADEVLYYFEFNKIDAILDGWLKKLRRGGRLVIGFTDIDEVARLFYQGHINLEQVNNLFFGTQQRGWDFKKCGFTLQSLVEVLRNKGYKIIKASLDGIHALVICERL